jgi:hypothetical protein
VQRPAYFSKITMVDHKSLQTPSASQR